VAWFKPALSRITEEEPNWLNNWDAFVEELKMNFGPYDQIGDTENSPVSLKMKDSQLITDYIAQFNNLSACCNWGDAAL
jgi:hypothetical protein